mmetsp:Transcript_11298/g.18394  ORF Transcript_11298/g.18394 Transcript_11298/m.18394 type:complete len:202 (+) Transcript_11298:196-801(+)
MSLFNTPLLDFSLLVSRAPLLGTTAWEAEGGAFRFFFFIITVGAVAGAVCFCPAASWLCTVRKMSIDCVPPFEVSSLRPELSSSSSSDSVFGCSCLNRAAFTKASSLSVKPPAACLVASAAFSSRSFKMDSVSTRSWRWFIALISSKVSSTSISSLLSRVLFSSDFMASWSSCSRAFSSSSTAASLSFHTSKFLTAPYSIA